MKFYLIFSKKSVPQWQECYYDYLTTKRIVHLCRFIQITKINILQLPNEQNQQNQEQQLVQYRDGMLDYSQNPDFQALDQIALEANQLFFKYHNINKRIVFLFCQMKIHELSIRLKNYQSWAQLVHESQDTFIRLVMNCYAQFKMLLTMTEINLQAYRKIKKKHIKIFSKFNLPSPSYHMGRITRTYNEIQNKTNQIQSLIQSKKQLYPRQARNILTEQIQNNAITSSLLSFTFGIGIGFSCSLMIVNFVLIGYHLTSNQIFAKESRVWRGIGFIILYLWATTISSYLYNVKRLNESLVFSFEEPTNSGKVGLGVACIFSIIYSIFFAFYIMSLSNIYEYKPNYIYLPVSLWGLLLIYLVISVVFSHPFRTIAKSFAMILGVPFIFIRNLCKTRSTIFPFTVIWVTEQLISLLIPITDSFYSFDYYTKNRNTTQQDSILKITEIFALILFFFRLLECITIYFYKSETYAKRKSQIFIGTRSIANMILVIISIASPKEYRPAYAYSWIACAAIFGIFNTWVDFFYDWDILELKGKISPIQESIFNRIQRMLQKDNPVQQVDKKEICCARIKERILNRKFLKFVLAINIILRYAGIICICPYLFKTQFPQRYLIITTIAVFLQIIRRLFWNLLRVQRQHLINCEVFRVRTDYTSKQQIVKAQVKEAGRNNIEKQSTNRLMEKRMREQLNTIKLFLAEKQAQKRNINEFLQRREEEMERLEKNVQERAKRSQE